MTFELGADAPAWMPILARFVAVFPAPVDVLAGRPTAWAPPWVTGQHGSSESEIEVFRILPASMLG